VLEYLRLRAARLFLVGEVQHVLVSASAATTTGVGGAWFKVRVSSRLESRRGHLCFKFQSLQVPVRWFLQPRQVQAPQMKKGGR